MELEAQLERQRLAPSRTAASTPPRKAKRPKRPAAHITKAKRKIGTKQSAAKQSLTTEPVKRAPRKARTRNRRSQTRNPSAKRSGSRAAGQNPKTPCAGPAESVWSTSVRVVPYGSSCDIISLQHGQSSMLRAGCIVRLKHFRHGMSRQGDDSQRCATELPGRNDATINV